MDLSIRVIRTRDFVRTDATGALDLARSRTLLLGLAAASGPPRGLDILIDVRGALASLTPADIAELVQAMMCSEYAVRSKLALLTRREAQIERHRFAELHASGRGFRICAFTDFEQAIEWLMDPAMPTHG